VNDLKTIACVIRIIGVNLVWKTVWRRKDSVTEVGYRSETLKSCLGDQNCSQKEVLLDSTRANTHSAYIPPGSLGEIGVSSGMVIPCRSACRTSSSN